MTTVEHQLIEESERQQRQNRRTFITLLALAFSVGFSSLLVLVRALLTGESWKEPVSGIIVGVILLGAAYAAKAGKAIMTIVITAVVIYSLDLLLLTQFRDVGLPLTLSFMSVLAIVASQVLSGKQVSTGIIIIVSVGIVIILADLYWPFDRGVVDTADTTIIYYGAIAALAFAFVVAILQFPNYTLRGKLISASVILITIVVLLTTVVSSGIVRQSLTLRLGEQLTLLGRSDAATATQLLTQQVSVLETLSLDSSLRGLIRNQNVAYGDEATALATIADIEEQWDMNPDLATPVLRNAASRTLATFQHTFPDHLGVMITDKYGGVAGATYTPEQYAHADTDWWQMAYNDGAGDIYIGQPEFVDVIEAVVIPIALPVYTADTNGVVGVLYMYYGLESILALTHPLGDTGRIGFLFNDKVITHNTDGEDYDIHVFVDDVHDFDSHGHGLGASIINDENLDYLRANPEELLIAAVDGVQQVLALTAMQTGGELPALDALSWAVIVQQEYSEAFAAADTLQRVSVILGIVAVVLGTTMAAYAAGWVTRPINNLTETAVSIAGGDFEKNASVETKDEIGTLAIAFNSMTAQMRLFISSLEDRVLRRTKALTTSSEVSRTLSTIVSVEDLVEEVVHQMQDAFGYYHSQLFLLDEGGQQLVLRSGNGEVGRKMLAANHHIPVGRGVVGRAAFGNETVLINDVSQDSSWLYNDDLSDTKCEIAVPIAIGNHVLGVLDIQHNVVDSFDSETVDLLQSIATQTALAIQNARTFERAEQQRTVLAQTLAASEQQSHNLLLLNKFSVALTAATSLDDICRVAEDHVLEVMQADNAAIILLTPSGDEVDVLFTRGARIETDTGLVLPVEGTVAKVVVEENRVVYLPEERPLTEYTDSQLWEGWDIKSVISTPLSAGTTAFGAINIGSKREKAFESIDVGFILQITSLLAVTIESQRLAERAQLLAGIVENHPDFIGVGITDGRIVYVNPSGLQMMGLPPDHDVVDVRMESKAFYAPEDADMLMTVGLPTAIEQGSWSREAMMQASDGAHIPVEETVGINYGIDGNVSGFSITMRDITERNAMVEALRNSEQTSRDFQDKLTLLHEISTDLSGLDDIEMMYEQAIVVGRELLDFDRVRLWLIDEKQDLMLGTFGMGADGNVYDARHFQIPFTDSWAASVVKIRQGREVSSDIELQHEGDVVGHGWQIAAVLLDAGKPIGWLAVDNLFAQEPMRIYEPELVSLFANTLANVIVSRRTANTFAKQASELQIVTEVSRSMAGLMDRDAMLQFVADAMWQNFGLYHVQIFMLHEQSQTLRLTAVSDPENHPPTNQTPPVHTDEQIGIISHVAYQRKPLIANDVSREPSYIASPDLPDTKAILALPLILGRELLGVIKLYSVELNYFTEIDINVQSTLASQIAAALQNVAQYQGAQESLAELTHLQEMVSRENWKAFMTSQTRTVQGYLFDQHTVQPIDKSEGSVVVEGETAVVSPLAVQGVTIGGLSARNPSGDPLTEDQQELLSAVSRQISDALERARLLEVTELGRQTLDLRASELGLLNEISQVVSAQLDLYSLFRTAGQRIQEALAATSVFFALYNATEKTIDFPYYHSDEEGIIHVPPRQADENSGFTGQVVLNRQPFIFNRQGGSANEFIEQGGRLDGRTRPPDSFLGVPMIVGDDLIGIIGVNSYQERRSYNEDDQRLLGTLASTVGVAVQNVRQFEATQQRARREQTLREISSQVNAAVDPESILRVAAREIGRALGWQTYVYLTEPDEVEASAPMANGQS